MAFQLVLSGITDACRTSPFLRPSVLVKYGQPSHSREKERMLDPWQRSE